jgi:hypothetical protein
MPIEPNGPAPYAPPSSVLDFLNAVRDRDLPTPYTVEVIARAGITDALAPRVMKALRLYDLVDEEDQPTAQMTELSKTGNEEFRKRLADVISDAYADVLQYVDPATAPLEKIQDQFRNYTPKGQRERMVTLFMGLAEFSGLAPARSEREAASPAKRTPRKQSDAKGGTGKKTRSRTPSGRTGTDPLPASQHYFIRGLLDALPPLGSEWPIESREAWTRTALAQFDLLYELPSTKGGDKSD